MKQTSLIVTLILLLISVQLAFSHCEIPCGIYSDGMRCDMIEEHITTIEKSMNMIKQLSDEESINYNQLVRWINNKDEHANEIQHIVSQYFMTQRLVPADPSDAKAHEKYVTQLSLLHEMLVYAMKSKQTIDPANTDTLRKLIHDFRVVYFGPEGVKHTH